VAVPRVRGRCWLERRGDGDGRKKAKGMEAVFLVFREKPRFERIFAGANDRTTPTTPRPFILDVDLCMF
jgi:hypothetical protein